MLRKLTVFDWLAVAAIFVYLAMTPSVPHDLAEKANSMWAIAVVVIVTFMAYRHVAFPIWCGLVFCVVLFYSKARKSVKELAGGESSSEEQKAAAFKRYNECKDKKTLEEQIVSKMCPLVGGSEKPSTPGYMPSEVSSLFVLNAESA